jgi:signal transduction histidine kinase
LQPVSIQLSTLIEENCNILSQQAKQKEISVLTHLDPSLYVWADLNTTHTIVRNLLSNAIKFTYAKGRIVIKMYSDNQQVYLAITDSGIGISPENLSKLFKLDEQFKQAGTNQEKGTGLGLILCKDFAEENGGAIKVESYPGKGSTFTLRLPAAKDF